MTEINFPKLEPPDTLHLRAAEGWLELGNAAEAGEDVARISTAQMNHPDVLEIRWAICAAGQRWEPALDLAEMLVRAAPDRSSGWVHRAYALRRAKTGGLHQAWDALRPAFDKFPKQSIIPYNLACYAAQLGRLDEAWDWLHKAMESDGNIEAIRKVALADPDLTALWDRLRGL